MPGPPFTSLDLILMPDGQLQMGDTLQSGRAIGSLRSPCPFATHTVVDRQVQVIYSVNYSAVLSSAEVDARLALISRVIDSSTNPSATDALWAAQDLLAGYYY